MIPQVGDIVHYVSYGTPGGEYPSACRAAIVSEAHPNTDAAGLVVLNPEGMFFNRAVPQNNGTNGPRGGTWHQREDCPA